jgi:hypothetical protein
MTSKGGPKTSKGKAVSAKNSRKHGLTAKGFISAEELNEHKLLSKSLIEEYQPQGVIEELLIQDLAMIRIQLERFKNVEATLFINSQSKAITAQSLVDYLGIEHSKTRTKLIEAINTGTPIVDDEFDSETKWLEDVNNLINPEESLSDQCKKLIIEKLRSDCIAENLKPLDLIKELENRNSNKDAPLRVVRILGVDHQYAAREKAERDEQLEQLADYELLDYIESKGIENRAKSKLQHLLKAALDQKENLVDAAIPAHGELDRLYRYRTTLEKQFTSKVSQLIQLQDMRAKKERLRQVAKLS